MKLFFICLFVPAVVLGGVTKNPLDESFDEFMEENHEFVEPGREHDAEEAAFEKHKKHAIENNADPNSKHTETVYPGLSELTDEEFAAAYLGNIGAKIESERALGGYEMPESVKNDPEEYRRFLELKARMEARAIEERTPASYDARKYGLVTPVKHQGGCGSCAAFTATAAFETCNLKAGASAANMDLSEQWLLNCGFQTTDYPQIRMRGGGSPLNGCNGAVAFVYAWWMRDNGGRLPHDRSLPYTSNLSKRVGYCNKNLAKYQTGAKVSNVVVARKCDTTTLKQMIHQYGHAMISVYAGTPFDNYRGQVLETCRNDVGTNHAVLAVGYGTENGVDYWLVKNSWGDRWGESGYIKIKVGTCGIEGAGCSVSECTKDGEVAPPPPPPPAPPASQTCDLSGWFGSQLTNGWYGTLTLTINGVTRRPKVKCTGNSNCQCMDDLGGLTCCQAACGYSECPPSNWG